ncbi:potassium channel family protein [Pelagibius sp. Alg239-R121]|uniref:potassium channel family protein n=1 Tax=Pelagibius sp. Alg239-R121 TaxID=2993448 RepID=UPI0024A75956|nr:potassium channel family protein [Pelagibius sp. Alg239-R121]
MHAGNRRLLGGILATGAMVLLITFAVADRAGFFELVVLAGISASVAFFFTVFPGSRFFAIAFANFLSVYTCVFVVFVETNFSGVIAPAAQIAYILPMVGFIAGTWLRRDAIREIVVSHRVQEGGRFRRGLPWVLPLVLIGAVSFMIPGQALGAQMESYLLVGAMALIALVVFTVSSNVSAFLLDTGLVFEAFFNRVQGLYIPAFAFLTFYSINVIVFASLYRILDRFSDDYQFAIDGAARNISFQESLYFSIITLSTVGYGDIVPVSSGLRALSAVQIVLGVLFLLFGFSEIMSYSKERGSGHKDEV